MYGETIGITNTVLEAAVMESGVVVATVAHSRSTVSTADKMGLMMTEDTGQTIEAVQRMVRPSMLRIRWFDISFATTLTARLPGNEVCLITFVSDGSVSGQLTPSEIGYLLELFGYANTGNTRNRTKLGQESGVDLRSLGLGEGWASPFSNGTVPHVFVQRFFYGEHSNDGSGQVLTVTDFALNPMQSLLVRGGEILRLIRAYYNLLGLSDRSITLELPYSDKPSQFVFPSTPLRVGLM